MDRTTDETDVVVEEYEEIVVGNLGWFSDRVEMEDAQVVSIQEPHQSIEEIWRHTPVDRPWGPRMQD